MMTKTEKIIWIIFLFSMLLIFSSCATEKINECMCTQIYWEYVEPRVYQPLDSLKVGCVPEITMEEATRFVSDSSNVLTVECIIK